MNFEEKTIDTEYIFKGKVINLRVDKVKIFNGNTPTREIIEHNGGVAIVAMDKDKKILLVKQFRKPFEDVLIEIPAGKLEKDELPENCASRELEEETGYKPTHIKFLFDIYPSPGFSNEKLYIYFTDNIVEGTLNPDEDENIEIMKVTYDEAVEMIYNGTIKDAKSIAGILGVRKYI